MANDTKKYIEPKVVPYKPTPGEFTQNINAGSYQKSDDPFAINDGYETRKYGEIAVHPSVAHLLELQINGTFWSPWNITAQNDYEKYPKFEKIDDMLIDMINKQIRYMGKDSFENTLKALLYDGMVYGFLVGEKNWKNYNGLWTIANIKNHSPFNFDIYLDAGWNIEKLYYRKTGLTVTGSDLTKFIVAPYPRLTHGRYYGRSALQSVYFDVKTIIILEEAQVDGVRALAIKGLLHHYIGGDIDSAKVDEIQSSLLTLGSGGLVSFEASQDEKGNLQKLNELSVMDDRSSSDGLGLIDTILDMLYKRVRRNLDFPDDLGMSSTSIGSYAKAKEEMNILTLSLIAKQNFETDLVNRHILLDMIKYNYPNILSNPDYIPPMFGFETVEEDVNSVVIDNMVKLVGAGIADSERDGEWLRNQCNIPPASNSGIEINEAKIDTINGTEQQGLITKVEARTILRDNFNFPIVPEAIEEDTEEDEIEMEEVEESTEETQEAEEMPPRQGLMRKVLNKIRGVK